MDEFESRDLREDEVPEHVWQFGEWLKHYAKKRRITKKIDYDSVRGSRGGSDSSWADN